MPLEFFLDQRRCDATPRISSLVRAEQHHVVVLAGARWQSRTGGSPVGAGPGSVDEAVYQLFDIIALHRVDESERR